MPKNATARDVVYWIGYACDHAPELELKHVVLNTHGSDGVIYVGRNASGEESIDISNVDVFSALRNKDIGTIWTNGCSVAETTYGRRFCARLAVAVGCDVVAGDTTQVCWPQVFGAILMPSGDIDDFEGTVYRWSAAGTEEKFYPNGGSF
jgi:hypothetical protein